MKACWYFLVVWSLLGSECLMHLALITLPGELPVLTSQMLLIQSVTEVGQRVIAVLCKTQPCILAMPPQANTGVGLYHSIAMLATLSGAWVLD